MSRKKFIQSHGATCTNWQWSWSFINKKEKFIIFGAWENLTEGDKVLIFSEDWRNDKDNRKNNGYYQSKEHIRLIEEEGYKLKTFLQRRQEQDSVHGRPRIKSFENKLVSKSLRKSSNKWYAY